MGGEAVARWRAHGGVGTPSQRHFLTAFRRLPSLELGALHTVYPVGEPAILCIANEHMVLPPNLHFLPVTTQDSRIQGQEPIVTFTVPRITRVPMSFVPEHLRTTVFAEVDVCAWAEGKFCARIKDVVG